MLAREPRAARERDGAAPATGRVVVDDGPGRDADSRDADSRTGKTIVLTDLQPGDELVIVLADEGSMPTTRSDATSPAGTSAPPGTSPPPAASTPGAPSALPRTAASAPPADASELMVFREVQAP